MKVILCPVDASNISVTLRETYQYVHKGKMWELQDYVKLCCSIFSIAEEIPKTKHLSSLAFRFWWNCYTLNTFF